MAVVINNFQVEVENAQTSTDQPAQQATPPAAPALTPADIIAVARRQSGRALRVRAH